DLQLVAEVEDCDFIANIGTFKRADTIEQYETLLRAAAKSKKPMICANPDLIVLRGAEKELCAGAVAARYEEIGGVVHYHGKPHVPIYAESFRRLGVADRSRVIGVGDALRTDVAGARAAGVDSIFIASSGIYAERLGIKELAPPPADGLARLYQEDGIAPTYALRVFNW
ncbi:MAG: HAD hydrolase-like protein, partial [Alphaproteobacteria bacterium]